jgi:iron complex outermembrane receptor protein
MNWLYHRAICTTRFSTELARTEPFGNSGRVSCISMLLLAPFARHPSAWRRRYIFLLCIALSTGTATAAYAAQPSDDFSSLDIEDLANIQISSVSKKKEPLSDAAAAVFVITSEDIRRSGYTSIPEVLRLAPNLQVARVDSSQYAITARGFNGTAANKLQVLIDGRSVYTPLFSGVFWDVQDVLLEDVERIEVISGPGGALWGSNAVNGVINIITRNSQNTQGTMVSAGVGTAENGAAVRYGGKVNEDTSFRLYAKGFDRDNTELANGTSVHDSWNKQQAGFRLDSSHGDDQLTLQGDVYDGSIDQLVGSDKKISGGNVLGRWNRALDGGASIQVQAYYDHTDRDYPGVFSEKLDTYDIDAQHHFQWGKSNDIVWGGGYRLMLDQVDNSASLAFLPANRRLALANLFAQDTITLNPRLKLTLGARVEHNSYTGLEFQPNARLAWKLNDKSLLWTSISRAVRTPSRIDGEFFVPAKAPFLLTGNQDFRSEKLTAYELGYRVEPTANTTLSISTFYNVYDELRSVELSAGGGFPFTLGNKLKGDTYGVEMWGTYRVNDWWRLSAGYNHLEKRLSVKSGSSDTTSVRGSDVDPSEQFSLRSAMNLAHNTEFDVSVRTVTGLSASQVPSYTALDARLGWTIKKGLELSLSGFNLLDGGHPEFRDNALPLRELDRSVYLKLLWNLP